MTDTAKKPGRPPKPATVEVIVMHRTNIQLDSAEEPGKKPFRWRGMISKAEFDLVCDLDAAAGREARLEAI